jgi:catechol 2,3-dioxygenase-like lactoylglutathione lyase family enzyme
MKKLFIIAILLINMKSMSQENNLFFDHQALIVNNIEKSGDFYLNILGLDEIPVGAGQDPPKRWFKTNNGKEIHLIQSTSEINELPKSIHMAFSPKNFELFIDNLKKKKINFTNWKGELNKIQERVDGQRQIWIQDPQGYWIEINDVHSKSRS